jgi:menaquinone-9 beta-reductase
MDKAYDVIIIGAGPAGASAAILLARSGWRVAMVEKLDFPRRKVCGECIAASNLPLLEVLGIGEALSDLAGAPLRRVALMYRDQMIHAGLPPLADAKYPWGKALGREHLDSLLLKQARKSGVEIFQPWTAKTLEGEPGRFYCNIAKAHSTQNMALLAPVLIAAHGSWEIAPTSDFKQRPHRNSDLFAFKANFKNTNLDNDLLPVLSFAGGYGGMVVGNHATTTLAFCIRRDILARSRLAIPKHSAAEAAIAYLASDCAGVAAMLSQAEQHGSWLSVGPIRPGIRMPRHGGHAFLIGNAAGEAHPIIGEGISMAIQSAWLLAESLAGNKQAMSEKQKQVRLHGQYAAEWRRNFAPRIHLAALFAHVAMRPVLADRMFPLLKRYPQLLTHAARWGGKVQCLDLDKSATHPLAETS